MAANASATTSNASSSSSSEIDSGGRNRNTLPHVPQVSVTTPCWWQYAEAAAVRAGSGVRVPGVVELDRHHRAAAADVSDDRVVGLQLAQPVADIRSPSARARAARSWDRISSSAPSPAAHATGLPP